MTSRQGYLTACCRSSVLPALLVAALLVNACSGLQNRRESLVGPTLSQLPVAELPRLPQKLPQNISQQQASGTGTGVAVDKVEAGGKENAQVLVTPDYSLKDVVINTDKTVTLNELENYYENALGSATDAGTRRSILVRLADISMLRSEDRLLEENASGEQFTESINRYRELVQLQRQAIEAGDDSPATSKQIDQMLYQISKAYALDGNIEIAAEELANLSSEYDDSVYTPEASFRRAELAFGQGDYAEAEQLYGEVIDQGAFTPFYQNAIYMYGWSQFKRSRYEEAIRSFTRVMDYFYGSAGELKTVPASQQSLALDTRRVMSLSFSYLEGPSSVSEFFGSESEKPYTPIVYASLGQLYQQKERYRDSAESYRQFVLDYPFSDVSPQFSQSVIDIYSNGQFPSLVIPAKEEYASSYGIDSEYWEQKPEAVRQKLKPGLKTYLEELAKYEHANGQRLQKQRKPGSARPLVRAAAWYDQFYRTFPQDEKTPEMLFLKSEALNDAGERVAAYNSYQFLAYDYELPDKHKLRGAEAGYATVLLAKELQEQVKSEQQKILWQERFIQRSLAFADRYASDSRAPGVLNSAAQTLLALNRQPEAIVEATRLVNWQPQADSRLRKQGWLVLGQSEFDLKNYQGADKAYGQALALIPAKDPSYASVARRRSASVYQWAQQLLTPPVASVAAESSAGAATDAGTDKANMPAPAETVAEIPLEKRRLAVQQLLRIQQIAPDSAIAQTAQYDAGNELLAMEDWGAAESVFLRFRQRYPDHPLRNTVYPKMVLIYQETEQWTLAAGELKAMANSSDDPEVKRQSLILAAELYDKSNQFTLAANTYQEYIKRYPAPFDEQLDAVSNLSLLYQRRKDLKAYEYWQNQLIRKHDTAKTRQTDRSAYLASQAQNYFAEKHFNRYNKIRLNLPIKQSLANKQKALKTTVASYQKLIDYGVVEFVTRANFYLGEVYAQLSDDLINSERPPGLDELALEEYDILLEDQAYPFEEKAIELHETNTRRTQSNIYDDWVKQSFSALAELFPGRYRKTESRELSRELY